MTPPARVLVVAVRLPVRMDPGEEGGCIAVSVRDEGVDFEQDDAEPPFGSEAGRAR